VAAAPWTLQVAKGKGSAQSRLVSERLSRYTKSVKRPILIKLDDLQGTERRICKSCEQNIRLERGLEECLQGLVPSDSAVTPTNYQGTHAKPLFLTRAAIAHGLRRMSKDPLTQCQSERPQREPSTLFPKPHN
jgi:hypothetical protein